VPGTRGGVRVADAPEAVATAGQAVVRVIETGVCGTDVDIAQGLYGAAPSGSSFLILGHESLGVVEYAPAGADVAAGDLVVATVRRPCPERCGPCAAGHDDMCVTGHYQERGIQ